MFLGKNNSVKDLEKEIKNHIDEKYEKVPSFESVMSKCKTSNKSVVLNKELVLSNGETVVENSKKKLLKIFAPVLIIVVLASVLIGILANRDNGPVIDMIDKKGGYFIIDVNPSIELSYDKDGNIKEAIPLNEDAEIVLYNLDLVGKNYKDVIDLIVEKLIELEYIEKENTNAILTTAVSEDGVKDENMTLEVKNVFVTSLTHREIKGEVLTGVFNEVLEKEAEEYGIDAQKLDLIKQLEEKGVEISKEEYSTVTIRELYRKISQREKEIAKEEKDKLKEENDKKKTEVDKNVKGIIDFLIMIVGEDSEYKEQLDQIDKKLESGENTADEVLEMLGNMELGGFELFLDMILFLKDDLKNAYDELNKIQKELDRSNMTLEEKYNERLENAKKNKTEEKDKFEDKSTEKSEKDDTSVDKNGLNGEKDKEKEKDKNKENSRNDSQKEEKPNKNNENDFIWEFFIK